MSDYDFYGEWDSDQKIQYEKNFEIFNLKFNLMSIKDELIYMINNFNNEFSLNFIIMQNGEIFLSIGKGIPYTEDYNIPLLKGTKFGYLVGHTHPKNVKLRTQESKMELYPPSSDDYITILEGFYRFYTKKHLVFSPMGIWEVQLNKNLLYFHTNNRKLRKQMLLFEQNRNEIDGYYSVTEWNILLEDIKKDTNNFHIMLENGTIEIESYIINMRSIGFDVKFTIWEDINKSEIAIDVPEDHIFRVNEFVKKQNIISLKLIKKYYSAFRTILKTTEYGNFVNFDGIKNIELFDKEFDNIKNK